MTEKRPGVDLVGRFADHLSRLGNNIGLGGAATPSSPSTPIPPTETAKTQAPITPLAAISTPVAPPAPVMQAQDGISNPLLELDLVQLQKEGFITPQNQRALIAEEFRIIKRPLLREAFDEPEGAGSLDHVVMITSARPGEGKTFTSINLALSVATERDLYVLLVDCDIRQRGLTRKLGLENRKGLMDMLLNPRIPLSEILIRTNIPNLSVIASGQPAEAATELFASQSMTKLVDDISGRYKDRFIIFDAPPVLASSEPGVLASHVGQCVMVVRANETSSSAVAESLTLIDTCPKVHFVLNGATMASGPDRFGLYNAY